MSFRLKSLALASFASLLLSLPAFSQTTAVEGLVKGPDGKPIVGAEVQFNRVDVKGSYKVKTDKKGHYGHYGLPIGNYKVAVLVDGQVRDEYSGVRTRLGEALPVNFDLKDQQPGGLPAEADTKGMSKAAKEDFDKKNKEREAALAKNKELNDTFQAGRAAVEAKQWDAAIENFLKASVLDEKQVVIDFGKYEGKTVSEIAELDREFYNKLATEKENGVFAIRRNKDKTFRLYINPLSQMDH